MLNILLSIIFSLIASGIHPLTSPVVNQETLAQKEFSLNERYGNTFVNDVFKDNILLTIDYLTGETKPSNKVNWKNVDKPFTHKLVLKPGETFAFHDDVLPQYVGKVTKTTNAHFNAQEGFKSD